MVGLAVACMLAVGPAAHGAEPVASPTGRTVSLTAALAAARATSPALRAASARIDAASGRREQAARWRDNPELDLDGASDRGLSHEGEWSASVAVSQTFEIGGQRGLRARAADAEAQAVRAGAQGAARDVEAAVATAFFDLLAAQQDLAYSLEAEALAGVLVGQSKRRLAAGDVSRIDHQIIEADAGRSQVESSHARSALVRARVELLRAIGQPVGSDDLDGLWAEGHFPAHTAPVPIPPGPVTTPALAAAQATAAARDHEATLAGRSAVPDVTVGLGFEQGRSVLEPHAATGDRDLAERLGHYDDVHRSWLLRLSTPLPLLNRNQGERAAAAAHVAEARAEVVARGLDASLAQAGARSEVRATAERLAILGGLVPSTEDSLALLTRAFAAGQIDALSLLAARDRVMRTRRDHLAAQVAHARARVELARVLDRPIPEFCP